MGWSVGSAPQERLEQEPDGASGQGLRNRPNKQDARRRSSPWFPARGSRLQQVTLSRKAVLRSLTGGVRVLSRPVREMLPVYVSYPLPCEIKDEPPCRMRFLPKGGNGSWSADQTRRRTRWRARTSRFRRTAGTREPHPPAEWRADDTTRSARPSTSTRTAPTRARTCRVAVDAGSQIPAGPTGAHIPATSSQ